MRPIRRSAAIPKTTSIPCSHPELDGLDRQKIRDWYNGYNWTGEAVYNPFDLLLLFQKRQFQPYWFETGTPTFLIDLLTERAEPGSPDLGRLETSADIAALTFEVDDLPTEALMFQAGYLDHRPRREQISGLVLSTGSAIPIREV
jgi:hypothetical protein